jgi:hypothetical protein
LEDTCLPFALDGLGAAVISSADEIDDEKELWIFGGSTSSNDNTLSSAVLRYNPDAESFEETKLVTGFEMEPQWLLGCCSV